MRQRFVLGAAACVLVALAWRPAWPAAQQSLSTIVGTVKDPSGGVLPGVWLTVNGAPILQPLTAVTKSDGIFHLTNVPAGSYTLVVELAGFNRITRSVTVTTGERVDLGTITLALGPIVEPDLRKIGVEPGEVVVRFTTSLGDFSVAVDRKRASTAADT